VALNCWVVPSAIVWLIGVMPIDDRVAEVTLSVVAPVFPVAGLVAVIVIGPPTDSADASPLEPAVLLMLAIAVFEELQVTDDVRSCLVRSVYIPVALYCSLDPRAML